MTRATKEVTGSGRDEGKVYLITEASAYQAEMWIVRAMLAMNRSGFALPPDLAKLGSAGVAAAVMAMTAGARFDDLKPLLDEMMGCVQLKSSSGVVRPLVETDTEEVGTRAMLKREVLELHLGFSVADALSMLASAIPAPATSTTSTSPPSAEQSSGSDEQPS